MEKVTIGIDPGLFNGIAIYENGRLELYQGGFWETIRTILKVKERTGNQFHVVIECPFLNKGTFGMKITDAKSQAIARKIAEDVGSNKRTAHLLVDFFKDKNISHTEIKPTKSKLNSTAFKAITGLSKTSQHERDAGMLLITGGHTHFRP